MEKQTFQDLKIWQQAHALTLQIYTYTARWPNEEKFAAIDQIRRAASSVAANIVEGYGRQSKKEFTKFLYISLGSLEETKYFLMLGKDLHYVNEKDYATTFSEYDSLKWQIIAFMNRLKQ